MHYHTIITKLLILENLYIYLISKDLFKNSCIVSSTYAVRIVIYISLLLKAYYIIFSQPCT